MANDIPEVDLRKLADTMSFEDLLKYRSQSFLLDDVDSDSSSDYERNDDGSISFFAAGGKYFEEELYDQYSGYFPEPECIEKDLLLYDLYEFLFPRICLYIDKAVEIFWIVIDAKTIILTDLYYELTSEGKTSQNDRCKSNDIQWFNSSKFRVFDSTGGSLGFQISDSVERPSSGFETCRKEDVEDQQFTNYVLTFGYYWFSNRVEHSPFRFRSFSLEKRQMNAPRRHPTPLTRDVRFIAPIMLRMFPDMRSSDRRTTFEFREARRKLKRSLLIERLRNKIEEIGNVIPIVTPPLVCLYAVSQFVNVLINKVIYPSFSLVRSLSTSYLEEFPPSDPVVPPWPCRAQAVISRAC